MTTSANYGPDVDAAAARVRELSDTLLETTKKNGLAWLQAYENVLESLLKLEQQAAAGSQVDWVTTLATAHADFVREVSQAYLNAIRQQLQ
jgi:hypothetical protein